MEASHFNTQMVKFKNMMVGTSDSMATNFQGQDMIIILKPGIGKPDTKHPTLSKANKKQSTLPFVRVAIGGDDYANKINHSVWVDRLPQEYIIILTTKTTRRSFYVKNFRRQQRYTEVQRRRC